MARNLIHLVIGMFLVIAGGFWAALEFQPVRAREVLSRSAAETLVWLVAWTLLVADVVLSLAPRPEHVLNFRFADKVVHFSGYLCLTLAFLFAAVWRPGRGAGRWPSGAAAVTLAVAQVGTIMEVAQSALGRDAELIDVVANITGCIAGLLIWRAVMRAEVEQVSTRRPFTSSISVVSAPNRPPSLTTLHEDVRMGLKARRPMTSRRTPPSAPRGDP